VYDQNNTLVHITQMKLIQDATGLNGIGSARISPPGRIIPVFPLEIDGNPVQIIRFILEGF